MDGKKKPKFYFIYFFMYMTWQAVLGHKGLKKHIDKNQWKIYVYNVGHKTMTSFNEAVRLLLKMQKLRDCKPGSRVSARKTRQQKLNKLKSKRQHDFETKGGNSSLERRVILKKIAVLEKYMDVKLLNDGTRADVIVKQFESEKWMPIQWKTTSKKVQKKKALEEALEFAKFLKML